MKYIVMDEVRGNIFTEEYDNLEEAIREADRTFYHMTTYDRKRRSGLYVLESVNPDEDADNHFDGNIVKTWI